MDRPSQGEDFTDISGIREYGVRAEASQQLAALWEGTSITSPPSSSLESTHTLHHPSTLQELLQEAVRSHPSQGQFSADLIQLATRTETPKCCQQRSSGTV